jgi:hypothetical protein
LSVRDAFPAAGGSRDYSWREFLEAGPWRTRTRDTARVDRAHVDVERLILGRLADGYRDRDRDALIQLPEAELTDQCEARQSLYEHVRGIWERGKADGLNPATDPQWTSVATLCDLTRDLWSTAVQAQLQRQRSLDLLADDAPTASAPP